MPKELTEQQKIERSIITKFRKGIWSRFLEAVKAYNLIEEGDRIAVCVSGGKDSMLLAKCIQELHRHSDIPFEAEYISMDPGYSPTNAKLIAENLQRLGIPARIYRSDIFDVNDLIGALTGGGFNLGRDKVWAESIRFFLENPLFGLGLMHHHDVQQGGVVYGFWLSHNSIYQAFSSLGLFGFITLMIHNIYKYKTFLKADLFSFFGLIALIGTELYGLIDCLMPAPYYVFPLLLLIFSADRVNLQNEKKLPLKKTFR